MKETEITFVWNVVRGAQFYEASIKESADKEDGWNTIRVRYPEVTFSGLTKRAGKNYLNEFASGQRDTKGIPDAIIVYQYALICTARIRIKDGRKEG
ncbi:MAG: hypothetical protein IJ088_14830, partial [Clostridia bacterium]|nr:hypothetical protein [Clostridia bacterium]